MFVVAEYLSESGNKVYQSRKFKDAKPSREVVDGVLSRTVERGATNAWAVRSKPSLRTLENAMMDGICPTIVCGCRVEPDGHCEHGRPSLLLAFGLI